MNTAANLTSRGINSREKPIPRMKLTANQRHVLIMLLDHVQDWDGGGYSTGDGNQERTLKSLEARGLVTRKGHAGLWWITTEGRREAE